MPPWGPQEDAALAKAMEEAAAKAAATSAPPVKTDKGATSLPVEPDKEIAVAAGEVSGATTGEDKGTTPPDAGTAPDLSFLPEDVRSKIHVDSEEAAAALKSGWMAHSEATKRFTEAKAVQRDADNYRALVSDPDLAEVVVKAVADKKAGKKPNASPASPPAEDVEPEVDPLDSESIKAHSRWEVSQVRKEMAALKATISEATRPDPLQAVKASLLAYQADKKVDDGVMQAAVEAANANLASEGVTAWTPETAADFVAYVKGFVANAKSVPAPVTPAKQPVQPTNGQPGLAAVTSPVSRGGTHQAHVVPMPKHYVNGEPPKRPRTAEEWADEDLYRMQMRFGPNVTREDLLTASRPR